MKNLFLELDMVKKNMAQNDLDWMHINVGVEGSGKSTLMMHACKYVDPDFNEDKIFFDNDNFYDYVNTAPKQSAIMLDEGAEALYSRTFASEGNIKLNKLLMRIRYRNLFIGVNIPDFQMIDNYIRNFRARSLTRCEMRFNPETLLMERGNFEYFNWKKIKQIHRAKKTGVTIYGQPNWRGHFKEFEDRELWQRYLKKKEDYFSDKGLEEKTKGRYCPKCPHCNPVLQQKEIRDLLSRPVPTWKL